MNIPQFDTAVQGQSFIESQNLNRDPKQHSIVHIAINENSENINCTGISGYLKEVKNVLIIIMALNKCKILFKSITPYIHEALLNLDEINIVLYGCKKFVRHGKPLKRNQIRATQEILIKLRRGDNSIEYKFLPGILKLLIRQAYGNFQGHRDIVDKCIDYNENVLKSLTPDKMRQALFQNELFIGNENEFRQNHNYIERDFSDGDGTTTVDVISHIEESRKCILSAPPGEGSYTTCKEILQKYKQNNPLHYVCLIELHESRSIFKELNSESSVLDILKKLINFESEFLRQLFVYLFSMKKIFLVFYNFSSICPEYTNQVIDGLRKLDIPYCVTVNSYNTDDLANLLGGAPILIKQLDDQKMLEFIKVHMHDRSSEFIQFLKENFINIKSPLLMKKLIDLYKNNGTDFASNLLEVFENIIDQLNKHDMHKNPIEDNSVESDLNDEDTYKALALIQYKGVLDWEKISKLPIIMKWIKQLERKFKKSGRNGQYWFFCKLQRSRIISVYKSLERGVEYKFIEPCVAQFYLAKFICDNLNHPDDEFLGDCAQHVFSSIYNNRESFQFVHKLLDIQEAL